MLAALSAEPTALACGILGAICLMTWPLFRTRAAMLLVQLGIGVGFGLHYALLEIATAALVNVLGAVQIAAALLFGTNPWLRWIGYALVPAIAGACLVTWHGLPSLLSASGMALIALGRVQVIPSSMRILVLSGCPFWLAHDLIIGSPLAVVDALSLLTGAVALGRQAVHQPAE